MSSKIEIQKTCTFCGNDFTAYTLHTRYCSHTCNGKHYKQLKRDEKIQQHLEQANQENPTASAAIVNYNQVVQLKQFLSLDETAQLIGASRRTIQRLITKGSIKAGKIGSRCIIQRTEIDKLFK